MSMATAQIIKFLALLFEVLATKLPAKMLDGLFIIFESIITVSKMEDNVLINLCFLCLCSALSQLLFLSLEDIQGLFKLSVIVIIQAPIQGDVVFVERC